MKKLFKPKRLLLFILIIYFIITFINQQKTINAYKTEHLYYADKISEQQEYNKELISTKENINSPEYIEKMAREKLDMYLPNERVYVYANK